MGIPKKPWLDFYGLTTLLEPLDPLPPLYIVRRTYASDHGNGRSHFSLGSLLIQTRTDMCLELRFVASNLGPLDVSQISFGTCSCYADQSGGSSAHSLLDINWSLDT